MAKADSESLAPKNNLVVLVWFSMTQVLQLTRNFAHFIPQTSQAEFGRAAFECVSEKMNDRRTKLIQELKLRSSG